MKVRLVFFLIALLTRVGVEGSSLSLVARDQGFATSVTGTERAAGWQALSDVEVVGDLAFVTWDDLGSTPRGMLSRVTAEGVVLDSVGVPAGGSSSRLVPEGNGVRLFWAERVGGEFVIRSSTVSSELELGTEVELVRLPIDDRIGGFAVAANAYGKRLLVLGPTAILLDGINVVRQTDLGGWGGRMRVSPTDRGWVVGWVASGGIAMWTALDDDLSPLGEPGGSAICNEASDIDIATNGEYVGYAVSGAIGLDVWKLDPVRQTADRIVELDIAFVSPTLTPLGPDHFLLAWNADDGIESAEIVDGSIGMANLLVPDGGAAFSIRSTSEGVFVVDSRGGCFHAFCQFDVYSTAHSNGRPAATALLSAVAVRQTHPSITTDDKVFLAIWLQSRDTPSVAWALSRDEARPPVHVFDPGKLVSSPVAGVRPDGWIVLWSTFSLTLFRPTIEGFLLDSDGLPVESIEIQLESDAKNLTVATSKNGWLAMWNESRGRIVGMRLGFDGKPLDEGAFAIDESDTFQLQLGLASEGDSVVAAWMGQVDGLGPSQLRTAKISSSGLVTPGSTLADSPGLVVHPAIECIPSTCLVVWAEDSARDGNYDVIGRFIDPSALVPITETFPLASSALVESNPLVAWDGRAWVVTWIEREYDASDAEVRGVRIEPGIDSRYGPLASTLIGPATRADNSYHALECTSVECLSLRVLAVDDTQRGRTSQLMVTRIKALRRRVVRRVE